MADNWGVSFIPGQGQDNGQEQGGPGGPQVSPTQQAIRLLSLRLPRFSGPNGFAPSSLLNGPGAAGNPAFGPNAPMGGFPGAMPSPMPPEMPGGMPGGGMPGGGMPGGGMPGGMPGGMGGLSPAMLEALRRLAQQRSLGTPGPHIIPGQTGLPRVVGDQPPEFAPVPSDAPSITMNPGPPSGGGGGGPVWSPFEDRSSPWRQ